MRANRYWKVILALGLASNAVAGGRLAIEVPVESGMVLGDELYIEVAGCHGKTDGSGLKIRLDGAPVTEPFRALPYRGRWYARAPLTDEGVHTLEVHGRCGDARVTFWSGPLDALDAAHRLALHYMDANPAERLKWDWEEAVFLHGLGKLRERLPACHQPKHKDYMLAYQRRWARAGIPTIDRSDRVPSALNALWVASHDQDLTGMEAAFAAARYVSSEPRNALGALNHLGHSWLDLLYPRSIWLDSLMMYGLFSAKWGRLTDDRELLDFAAAQPGVFASVLQDPATGLFRHAWATVGNHPIPRSRTFWLRGNGWVLSSLVDILEELPADHPRRAEITTIIGRVAEGLRGFQLPSGGWDSIANLPGFSYPETSGTSLAAYGIFKAVRLGWLAPDFLVVARSAYAYVTERLLPEKRNGLSLPGISGPTSPFPRIVYKLVPQRRDLGYGVGAYLMATSEYVQLEEKRR